MYGRKFVAGVGEIEYHGGWSFAQLMIAEVERETVRNDRVAGRAAATMWWFDSSKSYAVEGVVYMTVGCGRCFPAL